MEGRSFLGRKRKLRKVRPEKAGLAMEPSPFSTVCEVFEPSTSYEVCYDRYYNGIESDE